MSRVLSLCDPRIRSVCHWAALAVAALALVSCPLIAANTTLEISGVLASASSRLGQPPPPPGNATFSGTITVDSSTGAVTGWDIAMPTASGLPPYEFTTANSTTGTLAGPTVPDVSCPTPAPTHYTVFASINANYPVELYLYSFPQPTSASVSQSLAPQACTITAGGLSGPDVFASVYLSLSFNIAVAITSGTIGPPNQAPAINTGGVNPVYSTAQVIEPGSWVSLYGSNLASGTATWKGDFPQSLLGTSVTIDGRPAYLSYVSPGQINLQAPDDPATGSVSVVVTTPSGAASSTVTLGQYGPSLCLLDGRHVAAIILRADGSGAYGGGTYDIAGPTGTSLGYKTVAVKAGDSLELFGVGFGPTDPPVAAGKPFSGAAPATSAVQFLINGTVVTPSFAGFSSAGLFQINIAPFPSGLGTGDLTIQAMVGGVQSPSGPMLSLQ
jgi:uncharacterized protein (TIGR03437 family)